MSLDEVLDHRKPEVRRCANEAVHARVQRKDARGILSITITISIRVRRDEYQIGQDEKNEDRASAYSAKSGSGPAKSAQP